MAIKQWQVPPQMFAVAALLFIAWQNTNAQIFAKMDSGLSESTRESEP